MSTDICKIDIVIIGGGINGLWCAYSILKRFPNLSVVIFEAENYLGEHTTGRNSEVLHSGLYYPKNSMKHLHCLSGNHLWRDYIKEKKMPFNDCGKIIVAHSGQEEALAQLLEKAHQNEVLGIRYLKKDELNSLSDILHISDGFFIGSSGVLNVSEAIIHLKNDIEAMGGMVLKNSKVNILEHSPENFLLDVNGDRILTSILINVAGLFAINLRESLGLNDYVDYYVKGSYLKLKKKINIDKLIYPIPPSHGLGLGVHLTLDTASEQKFGPNTEDIDKIDYSIDESLVERMAPSIKRIFKNINIDDLQLGYSGIRPKIKAKKDGKIVTDFILNTDKVHGLKGYFEFLGIESPGLTASPSLAKTLSDLL